MKYFLKKEAKRILSFLSQEKIGRDRKIIELPAYANTFFGYYDISPFNPEQDNLICLHGETNSSEVDVLVYNLDTDKYFIKATSRTWNYQQGARLTWFSKNEIIFNSFDETARRYVSIIKNIDTEQEQVIQIPHEALFKDKYLISIDFNRLSEQGTEYGYKVKDEVYPKGAILLFDFNTNQYAQLFSEENCIELLNIDINTITRQHINHVLISPAGDYFISIFRYYISDKRIDHLMGYCLKKNKLEVLIKDQMVSHCTWKNAEEVVLWAKINGKGGYYLFNRYDMNTLELIYDTPHDGHPTFIDENRFISDTYPDRFSLQHLFIYNDKTKYSKTILTKKHPLNYTSYNRCDFHPALSLDRCFFQIDIIKNKKRAVCVGKL